MLPALIPVIASGIGTLIDRLIPDEAEKAKAKIELESRLFEAANQANLAQIDLNKVEAASPSLWKGGWRPAVGWVCAAALAWQFVIAPLLVWGAAAIGHPLPPPPTLDGMLYELLFAMLGIGGLRTFEKAKGLTR